MSWLLLAVAALVVAICESTHKKDCNCNYNIPRGYGQSTAAQGAQRLLQLRVDSQEQRLAKASTLGHGLRTKVDAILGTRETNIRRVKQILKRIEHLEGGGCEDDDHFACRDGSNRCVSRLLVCDTVKDCNNGADEDKVLCVSPSTGTYFEAHPKPEDSGCANRFVDKFTVTLTKVEANEYVAGRPRIEAGVHATSSTGGKQQQEYFSVKGSWDPSHHKLILNPPKEHAPWGLQCVFDGVDNTHCDGSYYNINTHEICGHFTFTKK